MMMIVRVMIMTMTSYDGYDDYDKMMIIIICSNIVVVIFVFLICIDRYKIKTRNRCRKFY